MRQIKLPHIPSDMESRKGSDLITDLWYQFKGKETRINQHKIEVRIRMKNIVIFGAPGSGKGTQSELLIKHYGLGHISTGDVLRDEIKKGTELGKLAASYIDGGNLIPDDLMISILDNVYDSYGRGHKGVIFDGFPRTIPQAEALKKMLFERGDKVAAMIELDVPEDELMARLIKRGEESGRSDDNAETIKKRLDVYHSQTSPLIEWYENDGIRHQINGLGELDRIFGDICQVVDAL
jgi:adenylate kinase